MGTSFVALAEAQLIEERQKGFDSYVFFGRRSVDGDGPQIYINNVYPGVELAAHFHKVDQFQVFFGNEGATFLRHPIPPVMVHYTDAYSTYGPFQAGSGQALMYATIRAQSTNFGGVMPGARDHLTQRGKRHLSAPVEHWTLERVPEAGAIEVEPVVALQADGLRTELLRLGPAAVYEVASPQGTSGRSLCVLSGRVKVDGQRYGRKSIGWMSPDSDAAIINAGPAGCALLVMDFPCPPTPIVNKGAEH